MPVHRCNSGTDKVGRDPEIVEIKPENKKADGGLLRGDPFSTTKLLIIVKMWWKMETCLYLFPCIFHEDPGMPSNCPGWSGLCENLRFGPSSPLEDRFSLLHKRMQRLLEILAGH